VAAVAALAVDQARGAVAADVVETANLPVLAANCQDRLVDDVERLEVPCLRHVVDVADEVPALAENGLALEFEELWIRINPAGQAKIVLGPGLGRQGALRVNTCIHC
jgi:hypothetical protein